MDEAFYCLLFIIIDALFICIWISDDFRTDLDAFITDISLVPSNHALSLI